MNNFGDDALLFSSKINLKLKGKSNFFFIKMRRWLLKGLYIFLGPYPTKSLTIFFFTMFVLSDVDEYSEAIPLKWTNAIRMHLALIPRAHTTVLAILRLLEMVLIVKVSLVFEGDVICILFPTLNVAVNCLELTFIRNSHRGGIILRYFVHKNESLFHCVLNV